MALEQANQAKEVEKLQPRKKIKPAGAFAEHLKKMEKGLKESNMDMIDMSSSVDASSLISNKKKKSPAPVKIHGDRSVSIDVDNRFRMAKRNELPSSLRVLAVTYNMARTKIDFDCRILLPDPQKFDIIALSLQEAKMGTQKETLVKLVKYLD